MKKYLYLTILVVARAILFLGGIYVYYRFYFLKYRGIYVAVSYLLLSFSLDVLVNRKNCTVVQFFKSSLSSMGRIVELLGLLYLLSKIINNPYFALGIDVIIVYYLPTIVHMNWLNFRVLDVNNKHLTHRRNKPILYSHLRSRSKPVVKSEGTSMVKPKTSMMKEVSSLNPSSESLLVKPIEQSAMMNQALRLARLELASKDTMNSNDLENINASIHKNG